MPSVSSALYGRVSLAMGGVLQLLMLGFTCYGRVSLAMLGFTCYTGLRGSFSQLMYESIRHYI